MFNEGKAVVLIVTELFLSDFGADRKYVRAWVLQDFIIVQNAPVSNTAHHRVIQGIADPTRMSTYEGLKLRNSPAML